MPTSTWAALLRTHGTERDSAKTVSVSELEAWESALAPLLELGERHHIALVALPSTPHFGRAGACAPTLGVSDFFFVLAELVNESVKRRHNVAFVRDPEPRSVANALLVNLEWASVVGLMLVGVFAVLHQNIGPRAILTLNRHSQTARGALLPPPGVIAMSADEASCSIPVIRTAVTLKMKVNEFVGLPRVPDLM